MPINWSTVRRATSGGIPYKLVEGYPKITHTEDGTQASEQYLIRASDLASFVVESMPPPYVINTQVFLPPRRRMPGTGFLITRSLQFEPHSGDLPGDPLNVDSGASSGTYDDIYRVSIDYATGQESDDNERDPVDPQTFLEHSVQVGGEFYTMKPTTVRYAENDTPNDDDDDDDMDGASGKAFSDQNLPGFALSVATVEHNMRWSFIVNPDWDAIFSNLGKVNEAIMPLFKNAAVETVLFSGVSGNQKWVWNGASARSQPWSLDFKFSQRVRRDAAVGHITWNHVWSNSLGKWVKPYWFTYEKVIAATNPFGPTPVTAADRIYMYETGDLYEMFRAA